MTESVRRFTVVAAVIFDDEGRVLLARRPKGKHMGGLWEFPGGKVGDEESPAGALEREIREELGVEIEVGEPLTFAVHCEPALEILLLFYRAVITSGTPVGLEGQELAWAAISDLYGYEMPPADGGLVAFLADGVGHGNDPPVHLA